MKGTRAIFATDNKPSVYLGAPDGTIFRVKYVNTENLYEHQQQWHRSAWEVLREPPSSRGVAPTDMPSTEATNQDCRHINRALLFLFSRQAYY